MDTIFAGSVLRLYQENLLDVSIIHGDGRTTAANYWLRVSVEIARLVCLADDGQAPGRLRRHVFDLFAQNSINIAR